MTFLMEKITKEKGNAAFVRRITCFFQRFFLVLLDFAEELPVAKTGHSLKPLWRSHLIRGCDTVQL